MSDEQPFNASGWSERDRLTRLEVLQQTDSKRIGTVERGLSAIHSKLDLLLQQNAQRQGASNLVGNVLKPAGSVLWGLVLAGIGWAIVQYLQQVSAG
ncbi:hypothetical protein [Roseomonas sp. USHLN139]|uniref:hypothetical protein n=1 Tax=Roseomonas sp. USHLN139 TaxID=3081298 RepID=UPI003B025228